MKIRQVHTIKISIWIVIGVLFIQVSRSVNNELGFQQKYDDSTLQKPVFSHTLLDSVLDQFPQVRYDQLPENYLSLSESESVATVLKYRSYYRVQGEDVFRFVVGHFRVQDFMSKDTFFKTNTACLPEGCTHYWLMDAAVLHKFLDLLLWMREHGYNDSALTINNGHRHPAYNKMKGGVSRSYHMQGMAIDIKVGDINRDGIADAADKQVLIKELDTNIIENGGGLGLYPHSDVIHFDTRGYRARWNQQ